MDKPDLDAFADGNFFRDKADAQRFLDAFADGLPPEETRKLVRPDLFGDDWPEDTQVP